MGLAFGREDLEKTFREIGKRLDKQVEVFLLGGGAMCLRNQKNATKDLDLVFKNESDYEAFATVIEKMGFKRDGNLGTEYEKMMAAGVWTGESGFRLDLFVKTVCNALELNERMTARAESLGNFERLAIRIVSNEDVVLFKGITERPDDANDIAAIIRTAKINWDIILEECKLQSKNRAWYGSLYNKLAEIKERHGIDSPITKHLLKLDKEILLRGAYEDLLANGLSRDSAFAALKKQGFTKRELSALESAREG
jgi:hypothetical protein